MSTKTILLSSLAIIVIGGAVLFSSPKKVNDTPAPSQQAVSANTQNQQLMHIDEQAGTPEPKASASSDEIIDYLIDDLTKDETKATESMIDTVPNATSDVSISTNF